jgi:NADPH:quinone reductase-like Zn-dependent oxidoreductase
VPDSLGMKIKRVIKWSLLLIPVAVGAWLFIAYWRSTNDCGQITAAPNNPMKAIISCEYGVDNLRLAEIEKPTPTDDEVLIRAHAASVNPVDGHTIRGAWLMRPMSGMRKPKNTRFGTDFAGVVEGVGKDVANYKLGDEVFGAKNGALAEYICVKADRAVVMKPSNVTFEQAGSVGVAGVTALQGLRDKGRIQTGQKVLINGASGGVGTFAVQIAKAFGADVTAVCSTRNVDLVKSIGADRVIDYTKEDFTKADRHYDVIYDLVGNHSFSERRKILTPKGICVLAGVGGAGAHPETMGRIGANFWSAFQSNFTAQKFVFYIAKLTRDDLNVLRDLMQSGKLRPVIDRTYRLEQTADAVRYMEEGHARGKVVISLESL